jgi:hypothetical protein
MRKTIENSLPVHFNSRFLYIYAACKGILYSRDRVNNVAPKITSRKWTNERVYLFILYTEHFFFLKRVAAIYGILTLRRHRRTATVPRAATASSRVLVFWSRGPNRSHWAYCLSNYDTAMKKDGRRTNGLSGVLPMCIHAYSHFLEYVYFHLEWVQKFAVKSESLKKKFKMINFCEGKKLTSWYTLLIQTLTYIISDFLSIYKRISLLIAWANVNLDLIPSKTSSSTRRVNFCFNLER